MKIALLAHVHFPIREPYCGGLEMHTALLAGHLAEMGHDVTLFAKEESEASGCEVVPIVPASFTFEPCKEDTFRWRIRETQLDTLYRRAMRRIRRGNYDVIINNSLSPVPILYETDVPMLTVFHTPPLTRLTQALKTASLARKQFVSVSKTNAASWQPHVPMPVGVVYNGIKVDDWNVPAQKQHKLVWAGRITAEKGLHLAIAVARRLGMPLDISGPVYDRKYFDACIKPMLSNTITYRGHLKHEELASFVAAGAVFLATPQWDEPFGLTVVEAMAAGTPVAALPRGAMPELITPESGALATADTVDALADAVKQALYVSGDGCKAYVKRAFRYEKMVARYLNYLVVEPSTSLRALEQWRTA